MEITLYPGENWPFYDHAVASMFPHVYNYTYHMIDDMKDSDWDYLVVSIESPMTEQQKEYLEYLFRWHIISNYMVSGTYIGVLS